MGRMPLADAVSTLYERTRIVTLPYEDPAKLRASIGDVLHRAGRGAAWWNDSTSSGRTAQIPAPFRVTPDINPALVRVQWLDCVDDDMLPLVQFMFPGHEVETWSPKLETGNVITVQYLSPIYYTVRAMEYRQQHGMQHERVPNLGRLVQFVRSRNRNLLSHWLEVDADSRAWFKDSSFELLDSQGRSITDSHRSHKTGFVFHATGFVGQAVYVGRDERAYQDACLWLQVANLFGAGSGASWGWSSVWSTCAQVDINQADLEWDIV